MNLSKPTHCIAALLFAAGAIAASPALHAGDDVANYDLSGIREVDFTIDRAGITLVGSDRSDLLLTLEKPVIGFDPEKIEQTVERMGDTLVIKIEYKGKNKSSWWQFSNTDKKGYTHAELLVPHDMAVSLKTSGGSVSAEAIHAPLKVVTSGGNVAASDIAGPCDLRTSGGNVRLAKIEGDTRAHTSGGNIVADDLTGTVDLRSSGGRIEISGAITVLNARTSGGSIRADLNARIEEPLNLNTSGGNIEATLAYGLAAPATLSTSGGSVTFRVPADQGFELYAKTNGGRVNLRHPGSFQGTLGNKKIEGSLNGGGPMVKLTTNGGGIRISEL